MKAIELIDAILEIDVNLRSKWECKEEYFEHEVKKYIL